MANVIGAVPEPVTVFALPEAHLHLYGKGPRPGRKHGPITLRAPDADGLQGALDRLRAATGLPQL